MMQRANIHRRYTIYMDTKGKLYLCATPIGNLGDISERVLETLRTADIIAAEDTRNSIKLLNKFDIKTPLTSYHEYNKYDKAEYLIKEMMSGKNIALITDAGTPAISDPGEVLVKMSCTAGIEVTSLPGPSAVITALTLSGLSTRRFVFEGFLSTDKKERAEVLEELKNETRTIVIYEAPHHLKETLKQLYDTLGDRKTALCRELTKIHETIQRMRLSDAIAYYQEEDPRGEYVLVIEGRSREEKKAEAQAAFADMSIEEHMSLYTDRGIDKKEAMKRVASDRGIQKREVYAALLQGKGESI